MTSSWSEEISRQERFRFGSNWLDFSESLTEAQIAQAVDDLKRLLCLDSLDGRSFVDIGSGSGLSSLAALRLGAKRVLALDYDRDSVACSERTLAGHAPAGADFRVVQDSILRGGLAEDYGTFDVVYAWGSLHHTGSMDQAIRHAAALCRNEAGARLALALYRKTMLCPAWRVIKKLYVAGGPRLQAAIRWLYLRLFDLAALALGKPRTAERTEHYASARGMSFEHDVHDWLGGYPYESISPRACRAFLGELGFRPLYESVRTEGKTLVPGCDEFLFVREEG